jgi:DNA-binding MarR family transcriptional regulator
MPDDNADQVDRIVFLWARERPDLNFSPMEIMGRILRVSRRIDGALHKVFKQFGLDFGLFDVLATLRRRGPPYQMPPSELNQWCMLSSGAMTKRLDRLESAGLVMRKEDPADRRGVLVVLSAAGLALVDQVVVAHLENERQILAALTAKQCTELAALLRPLLIHLEQTEIHGK